MIDATGYARYTIEKGTNIDRWQPNIWLPVVTSRRVVYDPMDLIALWNVPTVCKGFSWGRWPNVTPDVQFQRVKHLLEATVRLASFSKSDGLVFFALPARAHPFEFIAAQPLDVFTD